MSVSVEAYTVCICRSAVDAKYPGGFAAFREEAPNETFHADQHLAALSFMHKLDCDEFLHFLVSKGFLYQVNDSQDEMCVAESDSESSGNDWLHLGRWAGSEAAWLAGTDPEPLVTPFHYQPGRVQFVSSEEEENRLEYLRTQDGVEVFRDRLTGEKKYRGRTQQTPYHITESQALELQQRYDDAYEKILPFLQFGDDQPAKRWDSFFGKRTFANVLAELEGIATVVPFFGAVWYTLGHAYRTQTKQDQALDAFKAAYLSDVDEIGFAREYAGQCLSMGLGQEALGVMRRLCAQNPDDPELEANLSLGYLLTGDIDQALRQAEKALALDPLDTVTQAVHKMVQQVKAGEIPCPESISI